MSRRTFRERGILCIAIQKTATGLVTGGHICIKTRPEDNHGQKHAVNGETFSNRPNECLWVTNSSGFDSNLPACRHRNHKIYEFANKIRFPSAAAYVGHLEHHDLTFCHQTYL